MLGMSRSTAAKAKWKRIIAEQQGSGLSAARFCAERGLWASSLFAWKRKLADAQKGGPTTTGAFVEARVRGVDGEDCGGVTIELASGRRLIVGRGFDRQLLLEVIDALEEAGARS